MKVAFFLDNMRIKDREIKNLQGGNPGIGGTEYTFFNMVVALSKRNDLEVIFYLTAEQSIKYDIKIFFVRDIFQAVIKAKEHECDVFVARNNQTQEFYKFIDYKKMPLVIWAHNYNFVELNWVRDSIYTKRYVCVSKAQLETIWRLCSHKKSIYIFVGIADSQITDKPSCHNGYVVCQGALEEQKGFHVLAKIWSKIHSQYPEAKLHVIGSGRLYNDSAVMGKYGLAEEKYERRFMRYLVNEKGNIDSSVIFHGKLENINEKIRLIKGASVGVLNLTGTSECCPLSGAEMQALGVPLVTTIKNGCRDVVNHRMSGYTVKSEDEAVKRIVELLKNKDKNMKFSHNAIVFARERFDSASSYEKWATMLKGIVENSKYIGQQDVALKYKVYSKVYRLAKRILKRDVIYD